MQPKIYTVFFKRSRKSLELRDALLRICGLYDVNPDILLRDSVEESQVSDTAKYDAFMNRFAWRISLAIAGVVAGLALAALMQGFQ